MPPSSPEETVGGVVRESRPRAASEIFAIHEEMFGSPLLYGSPVRSNEIKMGPELGCRSNATGCLEMAQASARSLKARCSCVEQQDLCDMR